MTNTEMRRDAWSILSNGKIGGITVATILYVILSGLMFGFLGIFAFMLIMWGIGISDLIFRFNEEGLFIYSLEFLLLLNVVLLICAILWAIVTSIFDEGFLGMFTYSVRDRSYDPGVGDLFCEKACVGKLRRLKIIIIVRTFLWSMLFVVPGIIKGLSYSMAIFILIENPELEVLDALQLSKEMMEGNKMRLFKYMLSYIGWLILGIICILIPIVGAVGAAMVAVYILMGFARFYVHVSGGDDSISYEENTTGYTY